jgi:phosphatidylglycerophosphate synthase
VGATSDVTAAVLLATGRGEGGEPAAALPLDGDTVLGRLLAQLAGLGVQTAHVLARTGSERALRPLLESAPLDVRLHTSSDVASDLETIAALATAAQGDLFVASADIVTHGEALASLLADSRVRTGALCASGNVPGAVAAAEREPQGRLVSAGSSHHSVSRPNVSFLGAIRVATEARPVLSGSAVRLARLNVRAGDAVSLALVGLVRSGANVSAVRLRDLYWARPAARPEAGAAAAELAQLDEDRQLLDSAVKAEDSPFTTFLISPWSKYLARWAARRGWTPNRVTVLSLAIGVLAAAALATGERAGLIAGALLLQVSFVTDCVDGQLARYTRTFTPLGAWLDAVFDRTKEYVVYAGLAIGAAVASDPVWVLAGAALALQTVRHTIDFSYLALQREQLAAAPQPALEEPADRPSAGGGAAAAWDTATERRAVYWAKLLIAFPIGERFAAISLAAALADARAAFVVLLAWSGITTAYKMIGRLVRSIPR